MKHVALFTDYLPDDIKDVVTIHISNNVTSIVIPPVRLYGLGTVFLYWSAIRPHGF
jgi:hypothetical protein